MPNTQPEKLREEFEESRFVTGGFIGAYEDCPSKQVADWWLAKLTASNLATREEVKRQSSDWPKLAHIVVENLIVKCAVDVQIGNVMLAVFIVNNHL